MTADTQTASATPRRSLVPQFSLRLLFVLVTFSAIGTAIWYRWLIVEQVDLYAQLTPAQQRRQSRQTARVVRGEYSYRRTLGSKRLRHGWSREFNDQGQLITEELWWEGVRSGPARQWHSDGSLQLSGNHLHGNKDGIWETYPNHRGEWMEIPATARRGESITPAPIIMASWNQGVPDGIWKWQLTGPPTITRTMEFRNGVAVQANGQPWLDPLGEKRKAGKIENIEIRTALAADAPFSFQETPLVDTVSFFQDASGVPMRLSQREMEQLGIRARTPVTFGPTDLPLYCDLAMLLQPLGLAADYRYGCVMICPVATAEHWRDPTGVASIHPQSGTLLHEHWNQVVMLDGVVQPFPALLQHLTEQTGIPIEIAPSNQPLAEPLWHDVPVTFLMRGKLQHVLGLLLVELGFYVHQDGDRLVITRDAIKSGSAGRPREQ